MWLRLRLGRGRLLGFGLRGRVLSGRIGRRLTIRGRRRLRREAFFLDRGLGGLAWLRRSLGGSLDFLFGGGHSLVLFFDGLLEVGNLLFLSGGVLLHAVVEGDPGNLEIPECFLELIDLVAGRGNTRSFLDAEQDVVKRVEVLHQGNRLADGAVGGIRFRQQGRELGLEIAKNGVGVGCGLVADRALLPPVELEGSQGAFHVLHRRLQEGGRRSLRFNRRLRGGGRRGAGGRGRLRLAVKDRRREGQRRNQSC